MAYAHGKIILIGEHAVVHHTPAIVLPVFDAYVEVLVEPSKENIIKSSFFNGHLKDIPLSYQAIQALIKTITYDLKLEPFQLTIDTYIPVAAGMGASAAIASAITQALFEYAKKSLNQDQLRKYMNVSEKIAHGSPSGTDVEGVLTQKPLVFQKDRTSKVLTSTLNGYLLIVFSGIKGSTKEAVSKVQSYVASQGNQIIEEMEDTINETIKAYSNKDIHSVGLLLNRYQSYLHTLGVSHFVLDDMIKDAYVFGSLGAKLSGGGLGGCIIALFEDLDKLLLLKEHYKNKGYHPSFLVDLNKEYHDDLR